MPHRVIVISPDAKLGASMQDAFQSNGLDVNSTLIGEYPAMGRIKTIAGSELEPVAAFIVSASPRSRSSSACRPYTKMFSSSAPVSTHRLRTFWQPCVRVHPISSCRHLT